MTTMVIGIVLSRPQKPYGTSTQTVMMVRRDGVVEWHERFLDTDTRQWRDISTHRIDLSANASNAEADSVTSCAMEQHTTSS
eukprot:2592448-Pyramimonas_sp.AAC.1